MVEHWPSKPVMRVRSPSLAPEARKDLSGGCARVSWRVGTTPQEWQDEPGVPQWDQPVELPSRTARAAGDGTGVLQ